MNKTLENAIILTYQKYGLVQVQHAIKDYFKTGNLKGFTNDKNINIKNKDKFKEELFDQYLMYVLNSDKPTNELENAIKTTYNKYKEKDNVINTVKRCMNDFFEKNNHFTRDNGVREKMSEVMGKFGTIEVFQDWVLDIVTRKVTQGLIEEKAQESKMVPTNVKTFKNNIEKVREAMISGLTHDKEGSIQVANMQATTSIGNKRRNQEDAVLLMVHPKNPKFKMLVVSDGMGGIDAGEESSHVVISKMRDWFKNLPEGYYQNIGAVQNILRENLKTISEDLYRKFRGRSGATFLGAIVGEKETLISNVGDSRAYIVKGKELKYATKDQSVVQKMYDRGQIKEKDDMRFHRDSNLITSHIGDGCELKPQFYLEKNQNYDTLLLFSDGITDCLSDDQILAITKNTDRKELSRKLVENALKTRSYARDEIARNPNYNKVIEPGKDNSTAAVLDRDE